MGRRGPAPLPDRLLQLRGSNRAGRRGVEPEPDRKRKPRCPTWLPKSCRAHFRALVRQLFAMGVLAALDVEALARYCRLVERYREAEKWIEENGVAYIVRGRPLKDDTGNQIPDSGAILAVKTFPQVREARALAALLVTHEREYGLTPSARARLAGEGDAGAGGSRGGEGGKARFFGTG